jgi:hypothetical protein
MNLSRLAFLVMVLSATTSPAADPPKRAPREALQAFNDLIGPWRVACDRGGSKEQQRKSFWSESVSWEWRFKGKDAWLIAAFDKSKHFTVAELRYLPEQDRFRLEMTTLGKDKQVFEGQLKDRRLVAERHDAAAKEDQRFVITLLHFERYLYRYEVRPEGREAFSLVWQAGATKEGIDFASTDNGPECVVSGGLGTMVVRYNGKTYYVCCTGCRDAFKEDPEKYIKEYEARKKKK